MYDVMIVGSGPAGLTAAIYALRFDKKVLILEKQDFGGEITRSPKVENYPGFSGISGGELAEKMLNQAVLLGADTEMDDIREIRTGAYFSAVGERLWKARSVILATGTRHRLLDAEGEDRLTGRGISYCAVCDGPLYRGQPVAVVGGGNTALQEALMLSEYCERVTVVQNLQTLTGEVRLQEALKKKKNVDVIFDATVDKLEGEKELSALILRTGPDKAYLRLPVKGAFVAIGQIPNSEPFRSVCELDEDGYFVADEECRTKVLGIFVAGDCRQKHVRQIVTAASDGALAALAACRYAEEHRQAGTEN